MAHMGNRVWHCSLVSMWNMEEQREPCPGRAGRAGAAPCGLQGPSPAWLLFCRPWGATENSEDPVHPRRWNTGSSKRSETCCGSCVEGREAGKFGDGTRMSTKATQCPDGGSGVGGWICCVLGGLGAEEPCWTPPAGQAGVRRGYWNTEGRVDFSEKLILRRAGKRRPWDWKL